jgi:adenylate kinase
LLKTRSFATSPSAYKALPFFLNTRTGIDEQFSKDQSKVLRMVMFGKPGSGKGTLSGRLVKKYEIMSLSTGDILRQNISERTEIGRLAEGVVARGGLLSDDIMLKVVTSQLDSLHYKHWILDGFPRTLGQGKLLNEHLRTELMPLSLIINLDVADDVFLNRISERYVHLPSGRVYNSSFNRPKVEGRDDVTGEPLTKRPDDNPETFARRLQQFYASTSPLLSYYASDPLTSTKLVTLKGETSDQIWPQLDAVVRQSFPSLTERPEQRKRGSLSDAVLVRDERAEKSSNLESINRSRS